MAKLVRYGTLLGAVLALNVATLQQAAAIVTAFTGATTQSGRVFRDAIPSACGSVKAYPGIFGTGTTYNYETFQYTHNGPAGCVNFNFDPNTGASPCGTNAHLSIYNGANSYNPASQATNFIGDIGSSITITIGIDLVQGQTVTLVVTNTSSQATCTFSVDPVGTGGGGGPVVDENGIRNTTLSAIRTFLIKRADVITSSQPNTSQFHGRLTGSFLGGAGNQSTAFQSGETAGVQMAALTSRFAAEGPATANDVDPGIVSRSHMIANSSTVPQRMLEDRQSWTNRTPMGFNGDFNVTDTSGRFSFETSMIRMAQAQEDRAAAKGEQGLGVNTSKGPRVVSPFDFWTKAQVTYFKYNVGNGEQSGQTAIAFLGADYVLHPGMLVGAMVQLDWMDDTARNATAPNASGRGWMAGPYTTIALLPNLFFDARAAWGTSSNTIDPFGTYRDGFDTRRQLVSGKLTGYWYHNAWRFSPNAEVIHFSETQLGYVNSIGIIIPQQTVRLGRVIFGPEIGYQFKPLFAQSAELQFGLKGVYDFEKTLGTTLAGVPASSQDFRGKVEGGVTMTFASNVTVRALGAFDGIGDSTYQALQGLVQLNVPFGAR